MSEKNLTAGRLALVNLGRKLWRFFGLGALTGVFAAVVFGGSIVDQQLAKGLTSLSNRLGADALVVPHGYERAAKAALLRGEPSTYYMSSEVFRRLENFPDVAAATPQFYLASLATECCSERVQIIGYDPRTDFLAKPWTAGQTDGLQIGEIAVGAQIVAAPGDLLFFFGVPHKVAAKMERSGMGLDTSVLMPLEGVYDLLDDVPGLAEKLDDSDDHISVVAIKAAPGVAPKDLVNRIMEAYAAEFNLDFVLPDAIVTETARQLAGWSKLTKGLAAGLWLTALLVLGLVFTVSARERRREFGVYRLLGASRGWLSRLILTEAFLTSLTGGVAGLILAAAVVFPFNALIFQNLGLPHLPSSAGQIILAALSALALAAAVGPLASLRALWALTRSDVQATLRED
ncbi:MAG: ABC transporter permease [Deltaproteobacteria bacterium]|jgi:putative ABC transport system permease protein|nr:ABC transporter permease [Deltaproteobacteria bacterium]